MTSPSPPQSRTVIRYINKEDFVIWHQSVLSSLSALSLFMLFTPGRYSLHISGTESLTLK